MPKVPTSPDDATQREQYMKEMDQCKAVMATFRVTMAGNLFTASVAELTTCIGPSGVGAQPSEARAPQQPTSVSFGQTDTSVPRRSWPGVGSSTPWRWSTRCLASHHPLSRLFYFFFLSHSCEC